MSADRLRVRPARTDDDPTLLLLDRYAWPPGTGFPSFRERVREQASFFDEQDTPESHLVAELNGAVVGYVRLRPGSHVPEAAHVFGIFGLVVAESARRLGTASALLRAAETYVRERGGRRLFLHVLATNPVAQRVYERHGYVVEGRHRAAFLIDGAYVDDITMAKLLR
ncbi:MAG: GNAT family N-acetyltransferase [Micromonosporaceae bacterium]